MGALLVTYADWTTRPRGESTQPDLAGMGLTSSVGPLLTTATLPQARQAPHHRPACPRCTISQQQPYGSGRPRSPASREAEFSRLEAQQQQVQREIQRFRARDRLDRDQLHDRAVR
jgi:hypothetical protein